MFTAGNLKVIISPPLRLKKSSTSKKSLKNGLNNEPEVFEMFAMLPPFFRCKKATETAGQSA
jgi:hypothetical protein